MPHFALHFRVDHAYLIAAAKPSCGPTWLVIAAQLAICGIVSCVAVWIVKRVLFCESSTRRAPGLSDQE